MNDVGLKLSYFCCGDGTPPETTSKVRWASLKAWLFSKSLLSCRSSSEAIVCFLLSITRFRVLFDCDLSLAAEFDRPFLDDILELPLDCGFFLSKRVWYSLLSDFRCSCFFLIVFLLLFLGSYLDCFVSVMRDFRSKLLPFLDIIYATGTSCTFGSCSSVFRDFCAWLRRICRYRLAPDDAIELNCLRGAVSAGERNYGCSMEVNLVWG